MCALHYSATYTPLQTHSSKTNNSNNNSTSVTCSSTSHLFSALLHANQAQHIPVQHCKSLSGMPAAKGIERMEKKTHTHTQTEAKIEKQQKTKCVSASYTLVAQSGLKRYCGAAKAVHAPYKSSICVRALYRYQHLMLQPLHILSCLQHGQQTAAVRQQQHVV